MYTDTTKNHRLPFFGSYDLQWIDVEPHVWITFSQRFSQLFPHIFQTFSKERWRLRLFCGWSKGDFYNLIKVSFSTTEGRPQIVWTSNLLCAVACITPHKLLWCKCITPHTKASFLSTTVCYYWSTEFHEPVQQTMSFVRFTTCLRDFLTNAGYLHGLLANYFCHHKFVRHASSTENFLLQR